MKKTQQEMKLEDRLHFWPIIIGGSVLLGVIMALVAKMVWRVG